MGKDTLVLWLLESIQGMGWDGVRLCSEEQQGNIRVCPNCGATRRPSLAERWEKGWAFKQLVVTAQTINLEQRVEGEIAVHSTRRAEPSNRESQERPGKHQRPGSCGTAGTKQGSG